MLDVTLPDLNGLDLQKSIAGDQPFMPIIFITGYVPMSVRAMKAGAFEFLTKPFGDYVLLSAIEGAIGRSRAALSEEAELQSLRTRYRSLTPREREVRGLVALGLLNKQIADELGISVITVKAHRGSVMRKMRADSLAELVTINARLGVAPGTEGQRPTGRTHRQAGTGPILGSICSILWRRRAARAIAPQRRQTIVEAIAAPLRKDALFANRDVVSTDTMVQCYRLRASAVILAHACRT